MHADQTGIIARIHQVVQIGNAHLTHLSLAIQKYQSSAPKLAQWMESSIPEGLTVFTFPEPMRKRLRTSNVLERVNRGCQSLL